MGNLVGVPVLVHHKFGDLDGQGTAFLGREAVPAQHHAVGLGIAGRAKRRGQLPLLPPCKDNPMCNCYVGLEEFSSPGQPVSYNITYTV